MINSLYKETFHLKRRPIEKQIIDPDGELLNKQNTPPRTSHLWFSHNIFQRATIPLVLLFSFSLLSRPVLQIFFDSISIYCPKIFISLDLLNLFPAGFSDLISAGIVNDFLRIRRKQSQLLFFLRRFISRIVCELYCCLYCLEVNESRIYIKRTFIEANCSLQTTQVFSREREEGHHD